MTGYVRNDASNNISNDKVINASDLDGEFDAIVAAFNASTGHKHDGTSAEGAPIEVVGPAQDVVVTATTVEPKTNNTLDLGTASKKYKDGYFAGTVDIDTSLVAAALTVEGAATVGTTLGVTGVTTVGGNILPDADGTLDLGSGAAQFKDLWLGGDISMGGDLTASTGTVAFGGPVGMTGGTTISSTFTVNTDMTITGDILPNVDSASDLGSTTKRFALGYVDSLVGDDVQLGATTGINMVIDTTSIDALNNASGSTLNLNPTGGDVVVAGTLDVNTLGDLARLHVTGGNAVSLAEASPSVMVGAVAATNLVMDADDIQARNNGSASALSLNALGGNVDVGDASSVITVAGDLTVDGVSTLEDIVVGDGTEAAPSLVFSSDTDVGFYHDTGLNSFCFSATGTRSFVFAPGGFTYQTEEPTLAINPHLTNNYAGITSTPNGTINAQSGGVTLAIGRDGSIDGNGTGPVARFFYNQSDVGSVDVSGSGTSYTTSSDYRLKENVEDLDKYDVLTRILALKPKSYNFIREPGKVNEGFIAHELQEHFPQVVSGEKDGEQMQGVDYGQLTPVIISALQALSEKVDALQAENEDLKKRVSLLESGGV